MEAGIINGIIFTPIIIYLVYYISNNIMMKVSDQLEQQPKNYSEYVSFAMKDQNKYYRISMINYSVLCKSFCTMGFEYGCKEQNISIFLLLATVIPLVQLRKIQALKLTCFFGNLLMFAIVLVFIYKSGVIINNKYQRNDQFLEDYNWFNIKKSHIIIGTILNACEGMVNDEQTQNNDIQENYQNNENQEEQSLYQNNNHQFNKKDENIQVQEKSQQYQYLQQKSQDSQDEQYSVQTYIYFCIIRLILTVLIVFAATQIKEAAAFFSFADGKCYDKFNNCLNEDQCLEEFIEINNDCQFAYADQSVMSDTFDDQCVENYYENTSNKLSQEYISCINSKCNIFINSQALTFGILVLLYLMGILMI
ncbi:hypothetical protein PPERSA_04124 [Pseudocohnilembus persalinus]|uniref:Transmembrane protein n=1 Tax=Pseudocohnilembus persalinus TaxID=266149 RepID=A0A0V0QMW2_PSEPJ|nr:hypothetical protein PPERSA_04124 [Pseudocohnilembus persalinus]|eukprot:KRX03572.1 hypothetical protein PPERSA_04124 [Pseudocohnilembus persalinus]